MTDKRADGIGSGGNIALAQQLKAARASAVFKAGAAELDRMILCCL